MQTYGVQLKWQFSSIENASFWSIDNVTVSNDVVSLSRRELSHLNLINHHNHKRQTVEECNLYYDNFDYYSYNRELWSNVSGAYISNSPCSTSSISQRWLYFQGWSSRVLITQPLDLQEIYSVTFYLVFGNNSNGCNRYNHLDRGISVDYRIGNNGSWVTLEYYSQQCCTVATMQEIILPVAAQRNNVYLRWYQENFHIYRPRPYLYQYDVWAVDEIYIGNNLYIDTFNQRVLNTNIWLSVVGGTVNYESCGRNAYSLYFSGNNVRQAITHYFNISQAENFRIRFYFQLCDTTEIDESIEIFWRTNNGAWSLLETLSSSTSRRLVTLGRYDGSEIENIQFRISQNAFSTGYDTWLIDDFEVSTYNASLCSATAIPTIPPTVPPLSTTCNYYFDNFDDGTYKTSLWYTVSGIRIIFRTCGLPYYQHYALEFYSPTTRQLITQMLDLRGVEYIKFFLYSPSYDDSNRWCYRMFQHYKYLSLAYSIANNGIWYVLETYRSDYFTRGTTMTVQLPVAAQVNLVQLRWLDQSNLQYSNQVWILDDIEIGESVETILYQDSFSQQPGPILWSLVVGGSIAYRICTAIDQGSALTFSGDGTRESITQFLDLRQAYAVSFYLLTASLGSCDGLESGETVELSIRAGYGDWVTLQSYTSNNVIYCYVEIPENMKVDSVQLRWKQTLSAISGYDVWSIDSMRIHNIYPRIACSDKCIYDTFNSGVQNTSVWNSVSGAEIIVSQCNTKSSPTKVLYFNQENVTRQAITHSFDLRGMYAVSFYLQMVRYNNTCMAVYDDSVIIYYSINNGSEWIEIERFSGEKFATETFVTVPLPLSARNNSVSISIAQPEYSGSIWSIDDFGIYSTNQCLPLSVTSTPPTQSPMPTLNPTLPTSQTCNYYWDNFDSGTYKSTLWSSLAGVRIVLTPCQRTSTLKQYGAQFTYGTREMVTHALDLSGVELISFYLVSGNQFGCSITHNSHGIYVSYRIGTSSSWNTLEYFTPYCCTSGRNIIVYIPLSVQVPSVYLRWSQPNYSTNTAEWALDDVKIGNVVETYLYNDEFTSNYDSSLWKVILGAVVTEPPCGATYSGSALYFSQSGKREAITDTLDLRDARMLTFDIRVGSSTNVCEEPEEGEDIEFSYRINYNNWVTLQTFPATHVQFRNSTYVDITITEELQVIGVQFRFRQLVPSFASYDVWSIDHFAIISVEQDTKCSMACYSDNFNSGSYNSEF